MKLVARKVEVKQVERRGKEIQGVDLQGSSLMRLMMTGNLIQLKELHLMKGFHHPKHNHPGEESIGYVIRGHLKIGIGSEEYELRDGDSWCVPDGVFHWAIAVEDTYAVEIHSPPRPIEQS